MRSLPSSVTVRVDAGIVEVTARRLRRSVSDRTVVDPRLEPGSALRQALETSPVLGSGRRTRLRVHLETERVVFRPDTNLGDERCVRPNLPADLLDGLEIALRRRRCRGPATLELGPLARAEATRPNWSGSPSEAVRLIVDRSNAAVSVMVLAETGLIWARAVPATDLDSAVPLLIARGRAFLSDRSRLIGWGLQDVALCPTPDETACNRKSFAELIGREFNTLPRFDEVSA